MSNWPWWMYLIGFAHTAVYAWVIWRSKKK